MTEYRNRYPGAQPFSDDDFSRKVFFGRETAARELADKILANQLVTVYARSGLGKTSLLKAGVAPLLRDEGYLPLFVRVNDLRVGPYCALLETVAGEAARQNIEYVPGRWESLWSFFKTAEFWRDDRLLTPVLIVDQFEELFTLQSEEVRAHFLNELSYLIRGVRPPHHEGAPPGEELSDRPPPLRVVLSLREDCLGLLEDAAEHIPQILDARFRLAPLDLPAAHEAIVRPAALADPNLETRPFAVDPTAVYAILDYLSHARTPVVGPGRRYVELVQLQLICRRMEEIARGHQKATVADFAITMADLGGEAGLDKTLRTFYKEAIDSLPDWRVRRGARRLCQNHLISTEGRRLSLEEHEIQQQFNLSRETLGRLVAARLLRSENRSECTYYELSHDALVEPILASSRAKARVIAISGIVYGSVLLLVCVGSAAAGLGIFADLSSAKDKGDFVQTVAKAVGVTLLLLPFVVLPMAQLRGSARSLRRYRRLREPAIAGSEVRPGGTTSPTSELDQKTIAASSGGTPPQGWYPSPDGRGLTWWNGQQWTGHRAS
jgi:hypothetical protein